MRLAVPSGALFFLAAICFAGCKHPAGDIRQILADSDPSKNKNFIDAKFWNEKPLSQLINCGDFAARADSFIIEQPTDVHVYSVGEILYELQDSDRRYYLQSDDIELFFNVSPDPGAAPVSKSFRFSFAEKSSYKAVGVEFGATKIENAEYLIEAKVPWTAIGLKKAPGMQEVKFDVTVGDNDDGFVQKAKLAWHRTTDPYEVDTASYGALTTARDHSSSLQLSRLVSLHSSPEIDGKKESMWNALPSYPLEHCIYGWVRNRYDLSASISSAWDDSCLYFLIRVSDSRHKYITKKKLKEREIFVDYGWIENEEGEKIWEMTAKASRHAGGAFKNQAIDTVLKLSPGRYFVRYVTDESHSEASWTDEPPQTPFYGIVLYAEDKKTP